MVTMIAVGVEPTGRGTAATQVAPFADAFLSVTNIIFAYGENPQAFYQDRSHLTLHRAQLGMLHFSPLYLNFETPRTFQRRFSSYKLPILLSMSSWQ